jgi:hypothetical protein
MNTKESEETTLIEKEKSKPKLKLLSGSQLVWLAKLGLSEWLLISIGTFFLFITGLCLNLLIL